MQDIMKRAKMTPCGGGVVSLLSAGVQLKTNANMELSKVETTTPRSSVLRSDKSSEKPLLRLSVSDGPDASPPSAVP